MFSWGGCHLSSIPGVEEPAGGQEVIERPKLVTGKRPATLDPDVPRGRGASPTSRSSVAQHRILGSNIGTSPHVWQSIDGPANECGRQPRDVEREEMDAHSSVGA